MIYWGLERYEQEQWIEIQNFRPNGVILGDILCNKKMFEFSGNEIGQKLVWLKENGIRVIYQTPMYATDRVFNELVTKIEYYSSQNLIDAIIVQDIGAANRIHKGCPELNLIWGKMGYSRVPCINVATLQFYQTCGIQSIECKNLKEVQKAKNLSIVPFLIIGIPSYNTINRECYYQFEHNIFDGNCNCGCLKGEKAIIPMAENLETTIDGYILGYKYQYNQESINQAKNYENIIIYAKTIEELKRLTKKVQGEAK